MAFSIQFDSIKNVLRFFFLLLFLTAPLISTAAKLESLGRFEISEFALSPRLRLEEPGQGGFELSKSWITFEWSRDQLARGVLKLGSHDLTEPVLWISREASTPSFGVSEAWMEGRSLYGDLRAGLLSVPQSFEGVSPEWMSVLPESRVRRQNWLIKRDFGLQFRWLIPNWETSFTVHNGESGPNKDGKYGATAHWQYKDSDGFGVLLTGSFLETKAISTSTSTAASLPQPFVFDPLKDAKIRQGSLAFFRETKRNLLLVEGGRGEILQEAEKQPFYWAHMDAVYNTGGDMSLLFRYEQNQANLREGSTLIKSGGAGFSVSSSDNLQSLTFFVSRTQEEPEKNNNELWQIFRIHTLLRK